MKLPITSLHWCADDCFNAARAPAWLVHEDGGHYTTHQTAGDNDAKGFVIENSIM